LTLHDGSRVSGVALLTWVFASMDEVRQVQFIQHAPGDMTLKYVPGPQCGASTESNLRHRLRPYLREQTRLTLMPVQQIPKESSGKFRFIFVSFFMPPGRRILKKSR
jgi:phenylacetate-CoA ligase